MRAAMGLPLLFEIGTEELPAGFVEAALDALPGIARSLLAEARLTHGAVRAMGTPRRLALLVDELAPRQSDRHETVSGPPLSAAYDADGRPTAAAIGFARRHGVEVTALRVVETARGRYLAVDRHETGRETAEVLPDLLATLAARIPFSKSMRWSDGEQPFGRPVHWLLALLGDRPIPVRFARLVSGRTTRGHRFLHPEPIEIPHPSEYVERLREAHVLVDPAERRANLREQLAREAAAAGAELVTDEWLERESLHLVEKPFVLRGSFDPVYLELPAPVVIAVMRNHQRYFALRQANGSGELLPAYLLVAATAQAPQTIVRGNDRVLRARLEDARFFVREDRRVPLVDRVARLEGVVFQAELGSMRRKVERLRALVTTLCPEPLRAQADRAALLCKADLVTAVVAELPELQGIIGRLYALEQGEPTEVADAIADHHAPRGADDAVPCSTLSAALALADRADTLVGCLGVGLAPTGSADPYGLRRAAMGIARIALDALDVDLRELVASARAGYDAQGIALRSDVERRAADLVAGRLESLLRQRHRAEVVAACLAAWDGRSAQDLRARVQALDELAGTPAMTALAIAFKRCHNIARQAPEGDPDPALLREPAERQLAADMQDVLPQLRAHARRREHAAALQLVAERLGPPVDRFFDEVLVMTDEPTVRDNRLRLLATLWRSVSEIAHLQLLGDPA
ncbi:MAG: glycine--tRNA ligase subunit beta [Myxococcota bacterium]|nr:glycine--tRNA ligase subunit beta [Myxococcota bacterium]